MFRTDISSCCRINKVDSKLEVLCPQQGVFRVNCMDCLDRTNVIQSMICKEMLITMVTNQYSQEHIHNNNYISYAHVCMQSDM